MGTSLKFSPQLSRGEDSSNLKDGDAERSRREAAHGLKAGSGFNLLNIPKAGEQK